MNIPKIEEAITLLYQTYIEDQDVATQRGIAITAMNQMVKLLGGDDVVAKVEAVPYSARVRAQHLFEDAPQRKPLTDEQIRKLWAQYAAKQNGWPNDVTPPVVNIGNGPRFQAHWHESEYQTFKAGFKAAHNIKE